MIKILMLLCAFLIMPFAMADESVVVTAAIEKPAFYDTTHPAVMVSQERSYNVTGEDHAVTIGGGSSSIGAGSGDKWPDGDGFNRGDGPFEIGWRI